MGEPLVATRGVLGKRDFLSDVEAGKTEKSVPQSTR